MFMVSAIKSLAVRGIKKAHYAAPSCRAGVPEQLGLKLEKFAGDTVQIIHKSSLNEFKTYMQGIAKEGKAFKPVFDNPDSTFAKYFKYIEKFNAEQLAKNTKFHKHKDVTLEGFKDFIFDNADKLNVPKDEYWQLVDEIAGKIKKEVAANPDGLRKEFVDNADKIHKWAEIFRTQHYENGKNFYNKYYDEKMFNQAIKEFSEFVEDITGKKVLIGCPSRMNFPIGALGMLNNPKAYKDMDYILFGHGKNSSLITDITNPNTWRFSDNNKSIWEYIEQNVPKGKKVLVFSCETDGLKKAGKTEADMIDRKGQQMYGIGDMVESGFYENSKPAKLCESGIRHIIGQVSESCHGASCTPIGGVMVQGKCDDFSLSMVKNPKTIMYDLDFSKYKV